MTKNITTAKRGLALFLALVMCLGMLNITAFAAETDSIKLEKDGTYDLTKTEEVMQYANNQELSLEWESSDPSTVTVENGIVTAVGAGSATVTCKVIDLRPENVQTLELVKPEETVAEQPAGSDETGNEGGEQQPAGSDETGNEGGEQQPAGSNGIENEGDEQPAGSDETGNEGGEQPAGSDETGNEGDEQPAGSDEIGNEGGEQPAGSDETKNEGGEQPAGSDEIGNEGDEQPAGSDEIGNEGGEQQPAGSNGIENEGDEQPAGSGETGNEGGEQQPDEFAEGGPDESEAKNYNILVKTLTWTFEVEASAKTFEGAVVVKTAGELNTALANAAEDTVIDVQADISFEGKYTDVLKVGKAGTIVSSNGSTLDAGTWIDVGYQKVLTIGEGLILNSEVAVSGSGKFIMNGGKITNHSVKMDGGAFTMNGGEISGSHESAVCVAGGTFTMNDGIITNNTDNMYGGGVYISLDSNKWSGTAVFEMNGGTISGNVAKGDSSKNNYYSYDCGGGGVFVKTGSFTMNGGTITGNSATGKNAGGGGVYVASKQFFTMNGGTITGNNAPYGGGVAVGGYARSGGFFTMNGGTISDNKATYGGGVYQNGSISVSGDVNITGNTNRLAAPTDNNVYLPSGKAIGVLSSGLAENARIGVTPVANTSGSVIATGAVSEADIGKFSVSKPEFALTLADNVITPENKNLVLYKMPEARYTAPDGTTEEGDFSVMWSKCIAGGTVTLLRDATFPKSGATLWPVEQDEVPVILDLNGHTLDLNGKYFMVGNFTTNKETGKYIFFTGNLTLKDSVGDGVLTGGKGRNNQGGAVYVYYGTFTMDGGTIEKNSATYGGGVSVAKSGTFVMNSGTIRENAASYGGGVYVNGGKFTMNGGTIENHTVGNYGGGVYVGSSGTLTMNGGTIQNNTASNGGGIIIQTTTKGYIYGGKIIGNTATCNFQSDKDLYPYGGGGIYVNGGKGDASGELYLYNVKITDNHANTGNTEKYNGGAGIANCPTSNVKVYLSSGGAIYGNGNNTEISQVYVDGKSTEHQVYLSKYMLGGGAYNWTDGENNALANVGVLQTLTGEKIAAYNTVSSIPEGLATVEISGNSSALYGGGIGSNGSVIIGSDEGVLTLTKKVEGNTAQTDFSFTVTVGGVAQNVTLKAGETKVLSGLQVGANYKVVENTTGADSTTITVNGEANPVAEGVITAESVGVVEVVFTNTYNSETPKPETTSLTVNKVWANDSEANRPASVTVQLYDNGVASGEAVVLNAANGWSHTWNELQVEGHSWTVGEVNVPDRYTSSQAQDGNVVTITNTYNPPETPTNPGPSTSYTSRTVNKVWVGDDENERPAEVTVQLYRNGTAYATVTLNAANNWTYTWSGLNDSYTWTIGEINVPEGYTSTVSQDGNTVTITNTYEEEIPDEDVPQTDIPDEEPPLANLPEEPEIEIPDENVPLDATPKTGDKSRTGLWASLCALSLGVMAVLLGKKKKDEGM